MSLSRLMLRSLAVIALQKQDDDAVSPTMADDRVYDSRLDPLQFKKFSTDMPGIVVYTDDDDGTLVNRGSGDGPYHRVVDLRVEITIGSCGSEEGSGDTLWLVPFTDAELEAKLDLFETQVKWALFNYIHRAYTTAFRAFVVRVEKIASYASRDAESNNRFAQRRLHFSCVLNDDCPPNYATSAPLAKPLPIDTSSFPSPWLRDMLEVLHNSPSVRPVIDALLNSNNPFTVIPLLRKIGFKVDAVGPEADPNLLAAAGKTKGPDGRVEVESVLEINT